jgi:hypothetical protein
MPLIESITKNRTILMAILVPLLLLFLLLGQSFVLMLLIIGSILLSYFLGTMHIKGIGIELVLLISILTGMQYGSVAGAVVAFLLITFHMIISQHVDVYLLWVIPGYAAVGYLAGTTILSITFFGILAVLALNAFNFLMTALVYRENIGKFMPFAITNILFNTVLFIYIAPSIIVS